MVETVGTVSFSLDAQPTLGAIPRRLSRMPPSVFAFTVSTMENGFL